jgi:hypothetical protein
MSAMGLFAIGRPSPASATKSKVFRAAVSAAIRSSLRFAASGPIGFATNVIQAGVSSSRIPQETGHASDAMRAR